MSEHSSTVFNNSCLKVPRHPINKTPYPVYDQKLMHQLENQARKLSLKSKNASKSDLKSFIEFYDSIPEYDDINHLSNKEFYKRLDNLREKQRAFFEYLQHEIKCESRDTAWIDDYKNLSVGDKVLSKPFCTTPDDYRYEKDYKSMGIMKGKQFDDSINKSASDKIEDWVECYEKGPIVKPPSRRSVRIESPTERNTVDNLDTYRPKSRAGVSSAGSKRNKSASTYNDSIYDEFSDLEKDNVLDSKSAPSSPRKPSVAWKDCGITIPKPFQMTVRDEENKIVEDIIIKNNKPKEEKPKLFKAHEIPVESQIPLFDKIMYDQERRRQDVKRRSKAALKARMQPFSFTERDEEIQAITKRLSKSSPSLFCCNERPPRVKKFKAKPVPKNLFSNYVYKKMYEDEFYRALQKRIRSEEMLKAASLPPAMAKREKNRPKYQICPRSYKDFDVDFVKPRRKDHKVEDYESLDKQLAELEMEFVLSTPSPKSSKSKVKKRSKKQRRSSAESSSTCRSHSALESMNRSNLAAILRIQSARKRLEDEMGKRLEESRIKEEARWKEKIMRKRPVWEALAYSHEEDLNMRLQLRRDEERLRKEEHKLKMQTMLGRVHQQPTLFERQSAAKNVKTREELLLKLYKNLGRTSISPKYSSDDISDRIIEIKDDEQEKFVEMLKKEENAAIKGDNDNVDDFREDDDIC